MLKQELIDDVVYRASITKDLVRPLFQTRVSAGFPAPVENYVEGRIDLNRELIRHPLTTFYVRVIGDSMSGIGIYPNSLLIVDRAEEARDGHVIIARVADELCVKRLSMSDDEERVWLLSENELYPPIEIRRDDDFEIWGRVMYSIRQH
jgi:DNA polymerase V